MDLTRVLVVDDSQLGREALEAVLSSHVEQVITATSAAEGLALAEQHPDLSLIVACVPLGESDTDALAAHVVSRPAPRPRLILVEARAGDLDNLRFADLGADGYLAKPILYRDIMRVLKRTQDGSSAEPAFRVRSLPVGYALRRSLDSSRKSEVSRVTWAIHDLSVTGAYLETHGPIPVGTVIGLELQLPAAVVHAQARVVHVQQPSWQRVAGIGVVFTAFARDHQARLRAFIDEHKNAAAASAEAGAAAPLSPLERLRARG
jgi:CheY-like chemotaxis protein